MLVYVLLLLFASMLCSTLGQPVQPSNEQQCGCTDEPPPNSNYSCQQQQLWGKCERAWMWSSQEPGGYCALTCGRCSCESPPPYNATSQSQASSSSAFGAASGSADATPPPSSEPSQGSSSVAGFSVDCDCTDTPRDSNYSCQQQKDWGKCDSGFMTATTDELPYGYCQTTCGRCALNCTSSGLGTAAAPEAAPGPYSQSSSQSDSDTYSQPEPNASPLAAAPAISSQLDADTLNEQESGPPFPANYSSGTEDCGCSDIPVDDYQTCLMRRQNGDCQQPWMVAASWIAPYGNCQTTCGRCPAGCQWPTQPACPCRDVTPPPNASAAAGQNCQELVAAGACGEPWMSAAYFGAPYGYCQASCHRCPCTDIPPPPATYTCAQQVSNGNCNANFMLSATTDAPNGYCMISCGRCSLVQYCQPYSSVVNRASSSQG